VYGEWKAGTENGKVKMENSEKSPSVAQTQPGKENLAVSGEQVQRILSHNTWLTISGTPSPVFQKC